MECNFTNYDFETFIAAFPREARIMNDYEHREKLREHIHRLNFMSGAFGIPP